MPGLDETDLSTESEVTIKDSPHSVTDTVAKLTSVLAAKGVRVFATIDQRSAAADVSLELRETVLVLFGNPQAGTPVMVAAPLAALALPLKVAIWDDGGQTKVSYYSPAAIAAGQELPPDVAAGLGAIDPLTDAAVAP